MVPRTIVVAFDFSEASRRALEWARLFRARLHTSVLVVHVDAEMDLPAALRSDAERYATADERDRRARWLESEVRRVLSDVFGPEEQAVSVHIGQGRPSEVVTEIALEKSGDLVIVGSSGKTAVMRALLGSTTQELVRSCPLPVMTVQ